MTILEEVEQKIFNGRFAWGEIDVAVAKQTPQVLEALREACLIESYFSTYMAQMLSLFWYDNKATAMFTIEAFEAYTHYYVLRKYLDTVGFRPIANEEIIALRKKDQGQQHSNEMEELVNFGATEFFAANFFADLSRVTQEPILVGILQRFSKEEEVHAEFAFDLIADRISTDSERAEVLGYAQKFKHIGAYVLPEVMTAAVDNLKVIQRFNRRLEQLAGQRLSDYAASRETS